VGDEEKKPVVFELNAEKWKAMTPAQRLQHVNQLHKQMVEAMQEEEDSSDEDKE
jgi:hypothetical protein